MLRRLATLLVCTLLLALTTLTACSDDPTSEPPPTPDPIELSVEGAASDTSGAAVAGAAVAVYPGGGDSALDETATGEDGSYALSFSVEENDAPDALRLTFSAEGYAPEEATVDFAESITYNAALTPEATDDDGDDDDGDDPAEATVSGSVVGASNDDPVEGGTITGTAEGAELFTTATAADGTYEASFTVEDEPGEITFAASAEGYEDAEQTVAFAEEMTADFQLDPVDTSTEATISGTVTDLSNDEPIGGATITGTAGDDELFSATTAADGTYAATFTVEDEPNAITVTAAADGYEDAEETVTFAEEMTVGFQLEPVDTSTEATISGTVTDGETGGPVEAVTVKGEAQGTELFSVTTAAGGTYQATFTVEEEPDEITVTATAAGYEDAEQPVAFAEEMTADFALDAVDTSTEATISGTVTDGETDDPIEGAAISAETNGEELFSTTTASNGTYDATFTVEEEPDELTVTASADGYEEGQQTVAFAEEMTADFQLQPIDTSTEASISGTVTDEDTGDPIEGASVTGEVEGADLFSATTNASGTYEATFTVEDEPNEITLTATADDYEEGQQTIPFAEEMTADFALAPDLGEFTITATVVNADDEPVEGISVSSDEPDLAGTTGPGGQVTFTYTEVPGLPEITLTHTDPGGLYEEKTRTQPANEDVSYTATLDDVTVEAVASGTVTDDEGTPIEDATVTFMQDDLGIDESATTGTGGTYTLSLGDVAKRHLGAFQMEATAAAEGYEEATATPTLEETISQDFTLVSLTQSGVITFSVYNLFGDQTPETRGTTFTVRSDVEETSQMASGDEISLTIDYQDPELRIWHDHGPNNTYNDILILREMNQPGPAIDHDNVANNGMTENWAHGQSFDTLRVNINDLEDLQNDVAAYLTQFEHETNAGTVNTNEEDMISLAFGRTGRNIFNYGTRDGKERLDYIFFGYNRDTGEPISEDQLNTNISRLEDSYFPLITLSNGEQIFDYDKVVVENEDAWNNYLNQHGLENTVRIANYQQGNPTNSIGPLDTVNYQLRGPSVSLPGSGTNKSAYLEEVSEASAALQNPPGFGASRGFTMNGNEFNTLGKTMIYLNWILNGGTTMNN